MSADRVAALAEVIHSRRHPVASRPCATCEDIAASLLDSPAMRDLLADTWDEGHAIGALDAANRVIWNHPPTPNPHRADREQP